MQSTSRANTQCFMENAVLEKHRWQICLFQNYAHLTQMSLRH